MALTNINIPGSEIKKSDEVGKEGPPSANDLFTKIKDLSRENDGAIVNTEGVIYSGDKVTRKVHEAITQGTSPNLVTKTEGIRADLYKILKHQNNLKELYREGKDIFTECETLEDVLDTVYMLGQPISGSEGREYGYEELFEKISKITEATDNSSNDEIQKDAPILARITRSAGLREAVRRTLNERAKDR